jgi:hypothetical protein
MQTELRPASEETDGNIDQSDDSSKIGTLKLWIRRKALSTLVPGSIKANKTN